MPKREERAQQASESDVRDAVLGISLRQYCIGEGTPT